MKIHSCGAILYTIFNNKVYVVLGKEHGDWFPFKGKCESDESYEEAAIREIEEETCRLIKLSNINLECNYVTPRKFYHIGLVFVPYTFINDFYIRRKYEGDEKCLEKTKIKMFPIDYIRDFNFHHVTITPILYYEDFLINLQKKIDKLQTNKKYISPRYTQYKYMPDKYMSDRYTWLYGAVKA